MVTSDLKLICAGFLVLMVYCLLVYNALVITIKQSINSPTPPQVYVGTMAFIGLCASFTFVMFVRYALGNILFILKRQDDEPK